MGIASVSLADSIPTAERSAHRDGAICMRYQQWLLVLVVALGLSRSATAGIFTRKPKVEPAEQVPTLVMQLKTDKDEGKRQAAAEELRNFDPKAFTEIMTVLVDALTRDTAVGVRVEAASSIAKLRPINQQAGFALEQAASNDPSMRVRMAARQSLWQYHLVGYRSSKPAESDAKGPALTPPANGRHTAAKNSRNPNESPEPPLAESGPVTSTSQKPAIATTPVAPPRLMPAPGQPSSREADGPSLGGN